MKVLAIFFLLTLLFISCGSGKSYTFMADHIFKEFTKEMKQKNGFQICSSGGSMPGRVVKSVNMVFSSNYQLDICEARKLYVETLWRLLDKINNDKIIRPYLNQYPAKWENVHLGIVFDYNKKLIEKKVALMTNVNNVLYFFIYDPKTNSLKDLHEESIDDALGIVFGDDFCNAAAKE